MNYEVIGPDGKTYQFTADDDDELQEAIAEMWGEEEGPKEPAPADYSTITEALQAHGGKLADVMGQQTTALTGSFEGQIAALALELAAQGKRIGKLAAEIKRHNETVTGQLQQLATILAAPRKLIRDDEGRPQRSEVVLD